MWYEVKEHPEVALKRQLWSGLLEMVYGSKVDEDELFFQHTYLTIVAKTMAVRVLDAEIPASRFKTRESPAQLNPTSLIGCSQPRAQAI
jgi:hypothetical protein